MRVNIIPILAAPLALVAAPALAADNGTLGSMAKGLAAVALPLQIAVVGSMFIVGLALVAQGLVRLTNHERVGVADGLARIGGGAALIALPDLLSVGLMSIIADQNPYHGVLGASAVPQNCLSAAASAAAGGNMDTITCVAHNFGTNVVGVGSQAIFAFMLALGLFWVAKAVRAAATAHASGSPPPQGVFRDFIIGCLAANTPAVMAAWMADSGISNGTVGAGTGLVGDTASLLSYPSTAGSAIAPYAALITQVFYVLVFFGVLTVARGLLTMKAAHDNNGGMSKGIVFIGAGTLMANGKAATCAIVSTFIGAGSAGFFCA
jgi:hypothetical protein